MMIKTMFGNLSSMLDKWKSTLNYCFLFFRLNEIKVIEMEVNGKDINDTNLIHHHLFFEVIQFLLMRLTKARVLAFMLLQGKSVLVVLLCHQLKVHIPLINHTDLIHQRNHEGKFFFSPITKLEL